MKRSLIGAAAAAVATLAVSVQTADAACPAAYPTAVGETATATAGGSLCQTIVTYGRSNLSYSVNYNGTTYNKTFQNPQTYRAIRIATESGPLDEFKTGLRPVVLMIHGGGFSAGGRDDMLAYAKLFARRGFVAVMPSYQMPDNGVLPGSAQDLSSNGNNGTTLDVAKVSQSAQRDVQTAVRNLRAKAASLGINSSKIYATGVSAGAITALRVATRPQDAGVPGEQALRDVVDHDNNPATALQVAAPGQISQSSKVDGAVGISGLECFPGYPTSIPVVPFTIRAGACTVDPKTADDAPFVMLNGSDDAVIRSTWATSACAAYGTQCESQTIYRKYPANEIYGTTGHSDGSWGKCTLSSFEAFAAGGSTAPGGDHYIAEPVSCPARAGLNADGTEGQSLFTNTNPATAKGPVTVAMAVYQAVKRWIATP